MIDFNYTVIRSRRSSYTIRITDDNKIIVRVPLTATQSDVETLLEQKRAWIRKAVAFNRENPLARREVLDMKAAYVNGALVPVFSSRRNYIDAEGVHISSGAGFKTAYVNSLGGDFIRRFRETEALTALRSSAVAFRDYKSRWGCCDADDGITFNYKLLMLPPDYQRYVMIHELCHTVHHDHSAAFWALVGRFEPRYKALRSGLKKYSFLAKLY